MREDLEQAIVRQYAASGLTQRIFAALSDMEVDAGTLKPGDLAAVDEFHIGGPAETARVVAMLKLDGHEHVLDVGSGLGGPARHIASETGCRVTGIDIMTEFTATAEALSAIMGLGERTRFLTASALAMPFDAANFDAAITIHVAMNIADRAALYAEIARTLKPGAPFCLFDVMKGPRTDALCYPLPWASSPEVSFLTTPDETRALLTGAGFTVIQSDDRTAAGVEFFRRRREARAVKPPSPLGLHLLVGQSASERVGNLARALEEGAAIAMMMLARRTL